MERRCDDRRAGRAADIRLAADATKKNGALMILATTSSRTMWNSIQIAPIAMKAGVMILVTSIRVPMIATSRKMKTVPRLAPTPSRLRAR